MIIENYLKKIQDESIFAMDSIHTRKRPLKISYPNELGTSEQQRIMIDFDGVIHQYESWNDGRLNDEVIEGAKETIDELHKQGYEIVIFTTRASTLSNSQPSSDELIKNVKQWLKDHDIYYDNITAEKLAAVAYIDDRAIRFEGNWKDTLNKLDEITNG